MHVCVSSIYVDMYGLMILNYYVLFSSPDPKGHVSYSHHLASVVVVCRPSVVRRKLFQKSSPLKVLDQWKPNLVWIITRVSSFKIVFDVGWCTASPDTILKLDTLVMIQTKFGFHWSSTFRGEDFWKSLRRTTDDGRRRRTPSDENSSHDPLGQVS